MSTEPETPKSETRSASSAPPDLFETWRAARDASLESLRSLRDASLENWSKSLIDFVNSEGYSQTSAEWLGTYLTILQPFQRVIETTMTQLLAGLNMPTRADVTSLAARLTNIEIRLDDLDAKLDDIQRAVQALSALKDDIQHAIETLSASKEGGAINRAPTSPAKNANASTTSRPEQKASAAASRERSRPSTQQPGGKQGKAKEAS